MPEWLLPVLVGGGVQGLLTWGAIRVELRYLRRDIDHAHRRLDALRVPMAWGPK